MVEAIRQHNLSKDDLDEWLRFRKGASEILVTAACTKYVEDHVKRQDYSRSHYNDIIHTLNLLNKKIGSNQLALVRVEQLERLLSDTKLSAKRQNNMRGVLSGFWRWSTHRGHCEKNIVAAIPPIKIKKKAGGYEVLSPGEFALLLNSCPEHFIPWLTISGFAGLRQSEIVGRTGDRESALRWEDFYFDRESPVIVLRSETTKTNLPRIVPLCDTLMEWLEPWKNKTGLVHPHIRPSGGRNPVTQELGELIGGWRDNCLRASAASYRLAKTQSLSIISMEMGHTEKMLKNNYLNPRFEEDAELWFSLTPAKMKEFLQSKKITKIG